MGTLEKWGRFYFSAIPALEKLGTFLFSGSSIRRALKNVPGVKRKIEASPIVFSATLAYVTSSMRWIGRIARSAIRGSTLMTCSIVTSDMNAFARLLRCMWWQVACSLAG